MRSMVEGARRERDDRSGYRIRIRQYLGSIDPDQVVPIFANEPIPLEILRNRGSCRMNLPIDFDHQPHRGQIEIHHIRPDRVMIAEVQSRHPLPQPLPQ